MRIGALILSIVLIVLEALPFGAVLKFANPEEDQTIIQTFSYFDLTPFGYANFFPFLTALLSLALLGFLIFLLRKQKGSKGAQMITFFGIVTSSLPPILYGIEHVTIVSCAITALWIVECVLSFGIAKQSLKQ